MHHGNCRKLKLWKSVLKGEWEICAFLLVCKLVLWILFHCLEWRRCFSIRAIATTSELSAVCQSRMFLLGCFLFPLYLSGYASLSWPAEVQASTWLLPLKESELFISNWMENYFHETQLFLLNSQTQFTNQFSSIISLNLD